MPETEEMAAHGSVVDVLVAPVVPGDEEGDDEVRGDTAKKMGVMASSNTSWSGG